ncbi:MULTISPECIES: TRAP transporter large permease [Pseudomonadota]|jgi:tripartite ATP-independent transporter DctM subunit|uniref:TRAP transporter large permease n=1 Tax=Pseudomonadota TaxID=1224 RepID=UPI0029426A77|nr:TRAP transporter large permease [Marinobacter salarius]WOI19745.1 TRAP transporter large permease [Marinobacter salarius]
MDWQLSLFLLLGPLLLLMILGVPVVFAFFAINILGAFVFLGGEFGLVQMALNSAEAISSFSLIPIPLFILMGEVLFHTGLAYRAISAIERLISAVPGRLSIVSILGGTAFATLSGSSIANTAMMGSSMLPEMERKGYHPTMSMGPILAVGGIAMLIPPSALAVTLASLAGISISKLLVAGIVPGLLIGGATLIYVLIRCSINPQLAPIDDAESFRGTEKWKPFFRDVVPLLCIFFVVVGSMLIGWASPTESAAFGVIASFIASFCYKSLNMKSFLVAVFETAKISTIILFILVSSTTFSQILSFSGATTGLLNTFLEFDLSPFMVVIIMVFILLILGCFTDQISMIMLTLPFFMPLVASLQIDPIWFGVLTLIAMEISLLTPPFGLLLLVMKGVAPAGTNLGIVYKSALPFLLLQVGVLLLLVIFPGLSGLFTSLMN